MIFCPRPIVLRGELRLAVERRRAGNDALRVVRSGLVVASLLASASESLLSQASPSSVAIREVQVDGRPLKFSTEGTTRPDIPGDSGKPDRLRIPAQAQRLDFRFGPGSTASNPPVRFRYRLEGVDEDWREAGGEMRLTVKFLDSANNIVGATDFVARGQTPGWAGNVAASRFVPRREQVTVPPRAVGAQVELFSGGDEQTTGIMVIDELTVSRGTNANAAAILRFSSRQVAGKDLDHPLGVPQHWMRDGSKPAIAQVVNVEPPESRHVLAVVDTDSQKWGAWRTADDSAVMVRPGELLELRWNEMYSIGWGGIREASYSYLPPGEYRFRVQALTETGEGTGDATSLAITVMPRFWKTSWFLGGSVAVMVGLLVAGVRYSTWRMLQSRLLILEHQRAVERERARIARDLHDDLGASLTQIALLSELATADLAQPELARTHLTRIFASASGLARQLNEIVWAVNPANDTLEQFTSYICKFAQHYLSLAGVRCRLDFPEFVPNYPLPAPERHNLLLATKEALHNIVKHAKASQVWLRLRLDADVLTLLIEDDGKGCDGEAVAVAAPTTNGDGLSNMQNRMEQIGGRFTKQNRSGGGTAVRLVLPLPKNVIETDVKN